MLFDLTFPCSLTTFSGKKCISGKVICAIFVPLIEVLLYVVLARSYSVENIGLIPLQIARLWLTRLEATVDDRTAGKERHSRAEQF
jgi:hypothetical protein